MDNYQNPHPSENLRNQIIIANQQINLVANNIEHVIKGKRKVVEEVLASIIANGHLLLLDVPGVGKTILARSLAKSISTSFSRIQFTPDLLPTDITGVSIFNPATRAFEFKEGPVFTNILLADEINRASPKTQSALLEAMEERQVSIDNVQRTLPALFFVIATQNPIEHAGTYPLPAAQLDRFLMRLSIGYPDYETERMILTMHTRNVKPLDEISAVVSENDVIQWQQLANQIYTSDKIDDYLVRLATATRIAESGHGVSPRGTLILKRAARAIALLNQRDYVIPDDIQRIIKPVFAHRLGTNNKVGEALIEEIIQQVGI